MTKKFKSAGIWAMINGLSMLVLILLVDVIVKLDWTFTQCLLFAIGGATGGFFVGFVFNKEKDKEVLNKKYEKGN